METGVDLVHDQGAAPPKDRHEPWSLFQQRPGAGGLLVQVHPHHAGTTAVPEPRTHVFLRPLLFQSGEQTQRDTPAVPLSQRVLVHEHALRAALLDTQVSRAQEGHQLGMTFRRLQHPAHLGADGAARSMPTEPQICQEPVIDRPEVHLPGTCRHGQEQHIGFGDVLDQFQFALGL